MQSGDVVTNPTSLDIDAIEMRERMASSVGAEKKKASALDASEPVALVNEAAVT